MSANETNSIRNTRKGKHKQGKVRMGIYINPFRKAIALLAAQECDMTITDVIWEGIELLSKGRGILNSDGNVTNDFLKRYQKQLAIVQQSKVNG